MRQIFILPAALAALVCAGVAVAANNSDFTSQNVRTVAAAGSTYSVSVTYSNNGSTTWTAATPNAYKLGSQSPQDNQRWGLGRVLMNSGETVGPSGSKTFTFNVTAPTGPTGGSGWPMQWRMLRENVEWFGEYTDLVYVTVRTDLTSNDCTNQHIGYNNVVGLDIEDDDPDDLYLCYHNQWYDCGDANSHYWHTHATSNQQVGRWKCDLSNAKWLRDNDSQFISQTVPEQMEVGRNYTVAVTFKNTGWGVWGATGTTGHKLGSENPQDTQRFSVGRVLLNAGETVDPGEEKTFSFVVTAPTGVSGAANFRYRVVQENVEWFGDYSTNVAINVIDSTAPGDCRNIYIGYDDELLSIDSRRVCVDGTWYDCSTQTPPAAWYTRASNDEIRGSWICDMSTPRWRYRGETAVSVDHFPDVAIGRGHICMTSHAGLLCWGENESGQLGNGSTQDSAVPVSPFALPFSVQSVVAGRSHTCALTNGNVYCWGNNEYGQLGHGHYLDSYEPLMVSGISHATAIAAGDDHTCALEDGALRCWGRNQRGQLGDGTIWLSRTPIVVGDMVSGVTAVATGAAHTCAIWDTGLYCWGAAGGNGTNVDTYSAQAISFSDPRQIVAGESHTCALRSDGVSCWGDNSYGQLGDGTTSTSYTPVGISGLTAGIQTIAAGANHTCAMVDGGAHCWGDNHSGQIGQLTGRQSAEPVGVTSALSSLYSLWAGGDHSCGVRGGGVECWGANGSLELGAATEANESNSAVPILGVAVGVQAVAGAETFSCAIVDGGAQCWGTNVEGQLGVSGVTGVTGPRAVSGLAAGVQAIAVGKSTACAIVNGAVKCWGNGADGQIGNNASSDRNVPTQVDGLTSGAHAIAVSDDSACALVNGAIYCWGDNAYGQLGDGTTTDRDQPVLVSSWSGYGARTLVAGGFHFCAHTLAAFQCWGRGDEGQLGNNASSNSTSVVTPTMASAVTQVVAGSKHTCAINNGTAYCWGRGDEGQLGIGSTSDENNAGDGAVAGVDHARSLMAGRFHTCAFVEGGMKCWGNNSYGQLGTGNTTNSTTPTLSKNTSPSLSLGTTAAGDATCVVVDGAIQCWGRNDLGQLGATGPTASTGVKTVTGLDTSCNPLSCGNLGLDCGETSDRCGAVISCGSCAGTEYCGGGGSANVCGGCRSTTCAKEGVRCGQTYDVTCSLTIDCGACAGGDVCE